MTAPKPPAFDPLGLSESNATSYPEQFKALCSRWNRRLGEHAGLRNFGVNLTRVEPGGQTSARHSHARQDEFIWVLEGTVVLETNAGAQTLTAGMCAGFPAGGDDAHCFINRSEEDVLLLVIGDRTPLDEVTYPDIDNRGRAMPDGKFVFTRKDGTPH